MSTLVRCLAYFNSYLTFSFSHLKVILKPLVDIALKISNLVELTGREKPTVIT